MTPIRQLTPYLWVLQSRFYYNSGIIISQGKAAIIDAGMADDEVVTIREFIEEKQAKLEGLVLTHSHPDHILGPRHFSGIPVYAHPHFAQEVAKTREQLVSTFNDWAQQADFNLAIPFALPVPTYTLGEGAELRVGEITFRIHHFPGHAPDLLALYHPESRLLWASDMLSDGVIPIIQNSLIQYEKTLSLVAQMDIEIQIPGHGDPSINVDEVKKRLSEDRAYLAVLRQRVKSAVDTGKSLEETQEACGNMSFKEHEMNSAGHTRNIQWAWEEFNSLPASPADIQ